MHPKYLGEPCIDLGAMLTEKPLASVSEVSNQIETCLLCFTEQAREDVNER